MAFLQERMNQYDDRLSKRGERTVKKELNYDAGKEKLQNTSDLKKVDEVQLKQRKWNFS